MKIEHWHLVLEAYRKMQALLSETLPKSTGAPPGVIGADPLIHLRDDLLDQVASLENGLAAEVGEETAKDAVRPLVFLLDDQMLARLSDAEETVPLLQTKRYQFSNGGERFFSLADAALGHDDTQPMIFELYLFCLKAGFGGRYGDQPAQLRKYEEKLAKRIPMPKAGPSPAVPAAPPPPIYEFPLRYYLWTAAAVVGLQLLLLFLSNLGAADGVLSALVLAWK